MYELLKQYEPIGKRGFGLEELKILLKVDDKYTNYADFKRYCLIKAQSELDKHCDISFRWEEAKEGRRVSSLVFHIIKKKSKVPAGVDQATLKQLTSYYQLNTDQAIEILEKYQ